MWGMMMPFMGIIINILVNKLLFYIVTLVIAFAYPDSNQSNDTCRKSSYVPKSKRPRYRIMMNDMLRVLNEKWNRWIAKVENKWGNTRKLRNRVALAREANHSRQQRARDPRNAWKVMIMAAVAMQSKAQGTSSARMAAFDTDSFSI